MHRYGILAALDIAFAGFPAAGKASAPPSRDPRLDAVAAAGASAPPVGDPRAVVFRRLFDEYWARVRRYLECYVDDPDDVDELTAEVFVVAWRKLDPDRPMGLTWFLRTANNKLKDRMRRSRSRTRAMEALVRGLEDPVEPLDPWESLALRNALTALSARERQVVVLTYWNDLTAGEVAEVLRSSQGAVWTTLTRARTKLRAHLEDQGTNHESS